MWNPSNFFENSFIAAERISHQTSQFLIHAFSAAIDFVSDYSNDISNVNENIPLEDLPIQNNLVGANVGANIGNAPAEQVVVNGIDAQQEAEVNRGGIGVTAKNWFKKIFFIKQNQNLIENGDLETQGEDQTSNPTYFSTRKILLWLQGITCGSCILLYFLLKYLFYDKREGSSDAKSEPITNDSPLFVDILVYGQTGVVSIVTSFAIYVLKKNIFVHNSQDPKDEQNKSLMLYFDRKLAIISLLAIIICFISFLITKLGS